jgi:hypothetical protein
MLGDEFIADVSAALDRIWRGSGILLGIAAHAGRPLIRKATIQRVPYVIAFEEHEQHVLVLAVAHAKRRPLYWLMRVKA